MRKLPDGKVSNGKAPIGRLLTQPTLHMTSIRFRFPVFLLLAVAVNTGYAQQAPEGLLWLQKIARSARELNYAGTFVYQHGSQVETSRITHFVDTSGEHEKLEALDGSPREIIRNNDQVMCYFPDAKMVKVDKRSASRTFPALLPEQMKSLADNYQIRIGNQNRIAGHDCRVVILEPKDKLRYGHRFCAATDSGLLLKAKMLNERNDVVEQFAFTQLTIGDEIGREMVESRFDAKSLGWRFDRTAAPEASTDTGWAVSSSPSGFRKIVEMKRTIPGKPGPVAHLVYSDGLAAVSIFIEPVPPNTQFQHGLSQQGAINIYTRRHTDNMVTVLGEAPAETVIQIGNSVAPSK